MALFELIRARLGPDVSEQLAHRINADPGATANALDAAVPLLLAALAHRVEDDAEAHALHATLTRHHDGSLLDNLPVYLACGETSDGDRIISHILGPHTSAVEAGLSRATGIDPARIGRLLPLLAPIVLGAVGRVQRARGLDAGGLAGLLADERAGLATAAPGVLDALGGLLERDPEEPEAGGILGSVFGQR